MRRQELISFRKLVKSILPGLLASTRTSPAGLEFHGFREYEPGEDPTYVDWAASAFTYPREFLIRLGERPRNLMVMLLVDVSHSMEYRRNLVAKLWKALQEEAVGEEHQVGILFIGEGVSGAVEPSIGIPPFAWQLRMMPDADAPATHLGRAFDYLLQHWRAFSQVAVVLSDCLFDADYRASLRRYLKHGNEAVFIILRGGLEEDPGLPPGATLAFKDCETGTTRLIRGCLPLSKVYASHVALLKELEVRWAVVRDAGERGVLVDELYRAFGGKDKVEIS